jgi:hypothetical protein
MKEIPMGHIAARDVRPGNLLDLEGDRYAGKHDTANVFAYEYAEVEGIEWETPECVVVHTDQGSFGMPPDHRLKLGD